MNKLLIARRMAIAAILLCTLATINALFPDSWVEPLTLPLLFIGVGIWLLSVVWFLWGWLAGANEASNERRGVSASSYILAFLPLCYCYLLATDEARTKVTVVVDNQSDLPLTMLKIYGSGNIFLKPDTLTMVRLPKSQKITYKVKASTSPHMTGDIKMEVMVKDKLVVKEIAGPFSITPMNLKQDWHVKLDDEFLEH